MEALTHDDDSSHDNNNIKLEDSPSQDKSPKRPKKKRDGSTLRKAPQAPKRFKSSYICFFMAKQSEIKEELGDKATVTEISKRSAEMWRSLGTEERAYWDDVAAKDKQRYMVEKATYTGPWQVPWKRAKKDPTAPKRPMSAFLYFSQERRRHIKESNPDMKNTEVSRLLGELWRNASEEDRKPHIEREREEREKYKVEIASWRKDYEERLEAQKKIHLEQLQSLPAPFSGELDSDLGYHGPPPGYDRSMMGPPPPPPHQTNQPPPPPPPYGYGYPGGYYPYGPGPYGYPTNGKHHVILGPNGMPHYTPSPVYSSGSHPFPGQQPPPPSHQGPYNTGPPPYEDQHAPMHSPMHFDYNNPEAYSHEPQTAE